jgi:hypothetical protein
MYPKRINGMNPGASPGRCFAPRGGECTQRDSKDRETGDILAELRSPNTGELQNDIQFKPFRKAFTEAQRDTVINQGKLRKATIAIWGWYNQSQGELLSNLVYEAELSSILAVV